MEQHLRTSLDRELSELVDGLVKMAELVCVAIDNSMIALKQQDHPMAAQVVVGDAEINQLRFKLEEKCLAAIATQQPIAGDLRTIIAVMHSVVEVERMGDYAAGIAKTAIKIEDENIKSKPLKKLSVMAQLSREMLQEGIQAFIDHDAERARKVAERDAEMDQLYRMVFKRLISLMSKHPGVVERGTYLLWCAHNLERIADRVTNLAEQVIFMTTGNISELTV